MGRAFQEDGSGAGRMSQGHHKHWVDIEIYWRHGGDGNASKKKIYSVAGDRGLFVFRGGSNIEKCGAIVGIEGS
jgi:hypothetical protein